MELLIQSSDLFVMQVEMDVYTALKKVRSVAPGILPCAAAFLQPSVLRLRPSVDVPTAQPSVGRPHQAAARRRRRLAVQAQDGYVWTPACERASVFVFTPLTRVFPADLCEKEPFLDSEDGLPFLSVFKHVRLQYIINDLASARILERDNILPPGNV